MTKVTRDYKGNVVLTMTQKQAEYLTGILGHVAGAGSTYHVYSALYDFGIDNESGVYDRVRLNDENGPRPFGGTTITIEEKSNV